MKKRKNLFPGTNASALNNGSPTAHGSSVDNSYGKFRGKRPAARDGHTGIMHGRYFLIFGGDRHHMPFNDTFLLDVKAEITAKSFLF